MPLEDVDFNSMDAVEIIHLLKSYERENLRVLIKLVTQGYAFDRANYAVRVALADGEREAEGLRGT